MADQQNVQGSRRPAAALGRGGETADAHAERRDRKARKRREFQADNRRSVRALQRLVRRPQAKRGKR